MNSICLSAAPNLRCEGLSRTENIAILIPPAIELVFSLTLAYSTGGGYKQWLLIADGILFLLLALLDFLSHVIPNISQSLHVFNIIDSVLAATSFLPILAYMFFLFFFARTNLVSFIPSRFRRIIGFVLLTLIPFTLAFGELGSLLGIAHVMDFSHRPPQVLVGFSTPLFQRISLFFSAASLALMTLFQATLFSLAFICLVRAFLEERRLESSSSEHIHLFRGLGWLAAGLKLGAIESVVGFVNISFGTVLTRRVLRLFGRGALIIAVIKGMNVVEDFARFQSDVRERRSQLPRRISRTFISNPRNSTFREMSPQASSFHAAQMEKRAAAAARTGPSPLALGAYTARDGYKSLSDDEKPPLTVYDGKPRGKERVTVVYDGKSPPVLKMRISTFDLPVPPLPAATVPASAPATVTNAQPQRDVFEYSRRYIDLGPALGNDATPSRDNISAPILAPVRPPRPARMVSITSEALGFIPPPPPPLLAPRRSRRLTILEPDKEWKRPHVESDAATTQTQSTPNVSPASSVKRKPVPKAQPEEPVPLLRVESPSASSGEDTPTASSHAPHTPVLTPDTGTTVAGSSFEHLGVLAAVPAVVAEVASGKGEDSSSDKSRNERLTRLRRELSTDDAPPPRASALAPSPSPAPRVREATTRARLAWMRRGPLSNLYSSAAYEEDGVSGEVDEALIDEAWRRAGLPRVAGAGPPPIAITNGMKSVTVRTMLKQSSETRDSLVAVEEEGEEDDGEDEGEYGLGTSPGSYYAESAKGGGGAALSESPVRLTRFDSGVLGEEDRRLVRQGLSARYA